MIQDETIQELLVNSTLNFSADALRKVIEGFFEHLLTRSYNPDQCKQLLIKKVKEVSIEQNVVFGSLFVIDVLLQNNNLEMHIDDESFQDFLKIASKESDKDEKGAQLSNSKRMLITPNADISQTKEFIRVETFKSFDYDIHNRLKDIVKYKLEVTIQFLLCLYLEFPEVKYNNWRLQQIRNEIQGHSRATMFAEYFHHNAKSYLLNEHEEECPEYDEDSAQLTKDAEEIIRKYGESINQPVNKLKYFLAQEFQLELDELRKRTQEIRSFKIFKENKILKGGWKYITLKFAEYYNADMVILIDSYYLEMKNASDDKEVQSHIFKVISDMKLYSKCVIIFDLDSIAFIKEQFTGLKEQLQAPSLMGLQSFNNQASFSYTVQRQMALNACLDLIYNADPNGSIWYIAVSSQNMIILDYETKMQWSKSKSAQIYEEKEAKLDVKYKCNTCKEIFTLRENQSTEMKCKVHENLDRLLLEDKDTKESVLIERARKMIIEDGKHATMFKYLCCNATYGSKGCRSTHHDQKTATKYTEDTISEDHSKQPKLF